MPAFAVVAPAGDGVCEKHLELDESPSMMLLEQPPASPLHHVLASVAGDRVRAS